MAPLMSVVAAAAPPPFEVWRPRRSGTAQRASATARQRFAAKLSAKPLKRRTKTSGNQFSQDFVTVGLCTHKQPAR